jgi:drug/metabolite transporter (DMT)-like permease
MSTNKIAGIVMLVAGVLVLVWAYSSSSSMGSQLGQTLNGSMSMKEVAAYVGGVVLVLLGVSRLK